MPVRGSFGRPFRTANGLLDWAIDDPVVAWNYMARFATIGNIGKRLGASGFTCPLGASAARCLRYALYGVCIWCWRDGRIRRWRDRRIRRRRDGRIRRIRRSRRIGLGRLRLVSRSWRGCIRHRRRWGNRRCWRFRRPWRIRRCRRWRVSRHYRQVQNRTKGTRIFVLSATYCQHLHGVSLSNLQVRDGVLGFRILQGVTTSTLRRLIPTQEVADRPCDRIPGYGASRNMTQVGRRSQRPGCSGRSGRIARRMRCRWYICWRASRHVGWCRCIGRYTGVGWRVRWRISRRWRRRCIGRSRCIRRSRCVRCCRRVGRCIRCCRCVRRSRYCSRRVRRQGFVANPNILAYMRYSHLGFVRRRGIANRSSRFWSVFGIGNALYQAGSTRRTGAAPV